MVTQLTEDMIRIVKASISKRGGAIISRALHVYVGHHALKDSRGRLRRFERVKPARTAARAFIAEHNQTCINQDCPKHLDSAAEHVDDACPSAPRWTRQGRILSLDGVEAIHVERVVDYHRNAALPPVTCDAIADLVCRTLNETDLDALHRAWMNKP